MAISSASDTIPGGVVFVVSNALGPSFMFGRHLVQVGTLGHVGCFASVDATRYPRRSRVVLRTDRGLEIGNVLTPPDDVSGEDPQDGLILRGMTFEDELLQTRLEKHRDAAYHACVTLVRKNHIPVTLMDVEHLFDGKNLYFYFLGDVPPELEALTQKLAATYEAKIQLRQFTETLIQGCGPDCGTEAATGQGCGKCSTCCTLAGSCLSRNIPP